MTHYNVIVFLLTVSLLSAVAAGALYWKMPRAPAQYTSVSYSEERKVLLQKPAGAKTICVELLGGGGSDQRGASAQSCFNVDDLSWPITITVGSGGTIGGNTKFGPYLMAFGGTGKEGHTPGSDGAAVIRIPGDKP